MLERVRPLPTETVETGEALGRVLGADVVGADDVPPFDNSAMDGFAVRAADTAGASDAAPVSLALADESRAGRPATRSLRAGEAIRISTGAVIPDGADAVVRVEDTNDRGDTVAVKVAVPVGKEIRRAGDDIRAGERVLERGTRVGPAELGVLASVGAAAVECSLRPAVAVIATGDELVSPGRPLAPGQIRNTNVYSVPAQALGAGAEVSSAVTVGDDHDATVAAVAHGLDADALVLSGGVSVGEHDHVKDALAEHGVEQVFWGVALRPGHPTWFGMRGSTFVFGLPGNPVSAMVTFHLFVRPALLALAGAAQLRRRATAVIDEPYAKRPGRAHVVRCTLEARDDGWHVRPTKAQGSHVLTSMLGAQAFALLEMERGDVAEGERVEIELL